MHARTVFYPLISPIPPPLPCISLCSKQRGCVGILWEVAVRGLEEGVGSREGLVEIRIFSALAVFPTPLWAEVLGLGKEED